MEGYERTTEPLNSILPSLVGLEATGKLRKKACETSLEVSWAIPNFLSSWPKNAKRSEHFGTGSNIFYFMVEPSDPACKRTFSLYLCKINAKCSVQVNISFSRNPTALAIPSVEEHLNKKARTSDADVICREEDLKRLYERNGMMNKCSIRFAYDINPTFKHYFLKDGKIKILCKLCVFENIKKIIDVKQMVETREVHRCSEISGNLGNLFESGKLSDLTLLVEEQEFKVHKAILGARSPVFCAMFEQDKIKNKESRVVIDDLRSEVIASLLHYIYTGKLVNLNTDMVLDLYTAADKYAMSGLKNECSQFLACNLNCELVFDALVKADKHEDVILKEAAVHFIHEHISEIMVTEEWLAFMRAHTVLSNDVFLAFINAKNVPL